MIESYGASGELSGFDFPKLLIYLNDSRFEGKLIINIGEFNKAIFISKGSIAYVVSNDPQDSLDSVIIKYGMLSADKFKDAVEKAKTQQKSVAKYLIENNLLSSEDLIQASGLQIKEVIKNIITTSAFSYFLKKDSTPENIPNQKISPYQVTFDAFSGIEDIAWINKQLGPSKRIFVQSENFVERYKNLFYSEDTDLVVTRIDGKTDVETLITNTGLEGDKVRKILAALFVMNMLKLVSDSPLGTAEPVLVKKDDTDTQQIEAERIRKKVEAAGQESEITIKRAEPVILEDSTTEEKPAADDFTPPTPQFAKMGAAEITAKTSIGRPEEEKIQDRSYFNDQPLNEPDYNAQPLSTSTAHYMKILERQRKKTSRLTVFTLILIVLFGLTALFYIFVYQKNIESEETPGTNQPDEISVKQSDSKQVKNTTSVSTQNNIPAKKVEKTVTTDKPVTTQVKPPATDKKQPDIAAPAGMRGIKALMESGNYQAAAQRWKESLKGNTAYTLSVEIACAKESISKIYGFDPKLENLFVLPKAVKDRSCFRVCWGTYPDAQTARSKINTLPDYYRNQTPAPEPVLLKSIL